MAENPFFCSLCSRTGSGNQNFFSSLTFCLFISSPFVEAATSALQEDAKVEVEAKIHNMWGKPREFGAQKEFLRMRGTAGVWLESWSIPRVLAEPWNSLPRAGE